MVKASSMSCNNAGLLTRSGKVRTRYRGRGLGMTQRQKNINI
ncbi:MULTISPECIES: hypothetical protein [unclassified Rickettsia]